MSENLTDSFHPQEKFQANEINNHKQEEANELFDLINQLNDDNDPFTTTTTTNSSRKVVEVEKDRLDHELLNINVNTNEISKHALLINHTTPIAPVESLIKPIETISMQSNTNTTTTTTDFSSNSFNEKEKMNFSEEKKACLTNLTNDASNLKRAPIKSQTKIPRIPSLHKNENTLNSSYSDKIMAHTINLANLTNLPAQQDNTAATSPTNSLTHKLTHELNKLSQNNNPPRHTRSVSKPAGTNKTSRSMSTNTFDSREDLSEAKFNQDGTRNVKYVVNYKPKESQVKIFNKKLEIKTVSSKIGSLEKAATYVPSGGNVVIESKPVQWNAKSKIGSLDRAANYTPSGGNVKIETQKLNWNSQSKIGSLKHADYQPGGGNVKIENHKLNFKEKARPRTNTGLVMIEVNQNSYLSNNASQSSSSGNISQQLSPQSN